jgi:hypothetical protein
VTTTIPETDPVDTLTAQALHELRLQLAVLAGAGSTTQDELLARALNRVLELVNAVRTEDARWFHQREMELLRLLHREQLNAQYARSQAARERAAVVLWLRAQVSQAAGPGDLDLDWAADAVQRGEHRRKGGE